MTDNTDAKPLELTVTNFGPIAEAKIELRPMTVFVGPSNTGKSYMAALIYALHSFFTRYSNETEIGRLHGDPFWLNRLRMVPPNEFSLTKSDIESLFTWLTETIPQTSIATRQRTSLHQLPESVAKLVRPCLRSVSHFGEILDSDVARCFGVERTKSLVRYSSEGETGFFLRGNLPKESRGHDSIGYGVIAQEKGFEIDPVIPSSAALLVGKDLPERHVRWRWQNREHWLHDDLEKEDFAMEALEVLANSAASHAIAPLSKRAHYLPADRAGIMHSHQLFVRSLIASASRPVLQSDVPVPILSGVLGDFLEQLVALASVSQQESGNFDELAQQLEHALLHGAVRVERSEIDYPSFVYRPSGWQRDLPLMNTSSMVSELAPVVLYLRHVVQPGNLLIIEEPEAHLHPEMQAVFTRQLVAAVQSGIRILITTHSEWILEELANLVRLSELPLDRREGLEDEDIALSPDQLGAWFFAPDEESGGSVVREISLDEESATFPSGFGLVTESLYKRWVEITTRIQEN